MNPTRAFYNENDGFAAQWLRNIEAKGLIARGDVDDRSIRIIRASDLDGFSQCHFFAGIGVWSYALRLAGWPDDLEVWTGSCPCQPFSNAGLRTGKADDRHLWPDWFKLIDQRRPAAIFGEQVASKDGLGWFDDVSADLERAGYAVGAADLCAASVGAPHIRQRLYFGAFRPEGIDAIRLAFAGSKRFEGVRIHVSGRQGSLEDRSETTRSGEISGLADPDGIARRLLVQRRGSEQGNPEPRRSSEDRDPAQRVGDSRCAGSRGNTGAVSRPEGTGGRARGVDGSLAHELVDASADGLGVARCGLGHARCARLEVRGSERSDVREERAPAERAGGEVRGFWGNAEWLDCTDGKARPVEPGTFPLAHGAPARVGRLRGYGNAIVSKVAATFVESCVEAVLS